MKKLIALFLFAAAVLEAAEPVYVTVEGVQHAAKLFERSPADTVTGPIIFGGIGDAPVQEWLGKVVLLDRGGISFAQKAKNVAEARGLAVIVVNNQPGPANDGTLAPENATIPIVSVSQAVGAILKTKVGSIVRVGSPMPPITLPDPTGRPGEFLTSDGTRYAFVKSPPPLPESTMESELAAGGRLAFGIRASGAAPFAYQWIKNGTNIEGATSATFVIASVTPEDAGSYVCQISNEHGTAASPAHNVSVK